MKIITVDGYSGAGKSTQTHLLLEHYNEFDSHRIRRQFRKIQYLADRLFDLSGCPFTDDTPRLLWYVTFYRMMVSYGETHGCQLLILDEFFLKPFSENINPSYLDDGVRFFRDMLTFQSGREPVASFFIDVPANKRHTRTFYRDTNHNNETISIDLDADVISDEDHHTTEQWVALSEQIPYLHIIDGTQPIDTVSKEIISIIDGEFNENNNA